MPELLLTFMNRAFMQSYPPGLPLLCTVRISPLTWNDWEYEQWMYVPSCDCWLDLSPLYSSPLFISLILSSLPLQKTKILLEHAVILLSALVKFIDNCK